MTELFIRFPSRYLLCILEFLRDDLYGSMVLSTIELVCGVGIPLENSLLINSSCRRVLVTFRRGSMVFIIRYLDRKGSGQSCDRLANLSTENLFNCILGISTGGDFN